jgi:TctA family transporter
VCSACCVAFQVSASFFLFFQPSHLYYHHLFVSFFLCNCLLFVVCCAGGFVLVRCCTISYSLILLLLCLCLSLSLSRCLSVSLCALLLHAIQTPFAPLRSIVFYYRHCAFGGLLLLVVTVACFTMNEMLELCDTDDKRTKTAKELVNTEIAYVQHLNDIVEVCLSKCSRAPTNAPNTLC